MMALIQQNLNYYYYYHTVQSIIKFCPINTMILYDGGWGRLGLLLYTYPPFLTKSICNEFRQKSIFLTKNLSLVASYMY